MFRDGVITGVYDAKTWQDWTQKVSLDKNSFIFIDAAGKHVYPGFITALSQLGITEIQAVAATNDLSEVSAAGANIGEVLANLDRAFPGVKERIFDEAGEVRRFILVHVNGEDIRFLDGLNTPVADKDEVSITPALAGG